MRNVGYSMRGKCKSKHKFERFSNVHMKAPVLESLIKKYAGLKVCSFMKKRLQHKCFPVKFVEILGTPSFIEHILWLLQEISHELSLYCIWKQWMVLFCDRYWLPSIYFILLSMFPFFFSSFFFVDTANFWFWGKFVNT